MSSYSISENQAEIIKKEFDTLKFEISAYSNALAKATNLIENLEYQIYTDNLLITNLYNQLDVSYQIEEAKEKLYRAEKLQLSMKVGGVSFCLTLGGLALLKYYLN